MIIIFFTCLILRGDDRLHFRLLAGEIRIGIESTPPKKLCAAVSCVSVRGPVSTRARSAAVQARCSRRLARTASHLLYIT